MNTDEQISFTYGDSMSTRKREGELTILTKKMLLELMENYAGTPEAFVKESMKSMDMLRCKYGGI